MTITTEVREPHVMTLLCGEQVVGTLDLRKYMPRRTRIRGHRQRGHRWRGRWRCGR